MAASTDSTPKLARRSDDVLVREDLMDVTFLLDRSGSMGGQAQIDTIEGFNKLLHDQQEVPGEALMSLIQFDDRYEPNYIAKPIKDCPFLTQQTYVPRGGTKLFDSVSRAIADIKARLAQTTDATRPGKVVLFIFTDGGEYDSTEVDEAGFRELLKGCRDQLWTVVMVGCDEASLAGATKRGVAQGNNVAFNKSNHGTKAAMARASKGMGAIRGMSMSSYAGAQGSPGPSGPSGSPGLDGHTLSAAPAYENFAELSALTPEEDAEARK